MTTSLSDAVQQTERALLGAVLQDNSLWPQTEAVTVDDFLLDSHRRIYSHMAAMFQDQRPVDLVTMGTEFPIWTSAAGQATSQS
jgi:replicative DNA helicase